MKILKKLLKMKNVYFGFSSKILLENINLNIYQGEHLLIIGPNGGGKTTLLKLIVGILKPLQGEIFIFPEIKQKIGYVPQFSNFNFNFPITVIDMVLTGCLHRKNFFKKYTNSQIEKSKFILNKLNLFKKRYKNIHLLSGGEIQRLLIARALISDPIMLLLDEPTTSIDQISQLTFLDLINELKLKLTIIIVTHDPTPFANIYKHIACINRFLTYHNKGKLNKTHLESLYGCPIELIGHGIPHTILDIH